MTRAFEFVIVGGGVYGTALAWELARHGASVALLEARRIASGASGGPGKRGVRANSRDERELPLSRLANEIWPALAQEIGAATGYERIGGLELFESRTTLERAAAQAELQERYGIRTRLIERDELHELEPDLNERVIGAVCCPDDGVIDHTATTAGLARAAQRAGAEIFEETPVRQLERIGDRVTAVVCENERCEVTRAAVLLANYGVVDLLAPLEVALPLARVFPQVLLIDAPPGVRVHHLVGHLERRAIVKRHGGGELMITGGWLGRWNDAARRGETVAEHVAGNLAEAQAVFPALDGASIKHAFADRAEAVRAELLPVIDRVPGFDNLVVGTAWSGHGFAIAPAVSRLLASWLRAGGRPLELEPFRWPEH